MKYIKLQYQTPFEQYVWINPALICSIESSTRSTIIFLSNGKEYVVKQSVEEIQSLIANI